MLASFSSALDFSLCGGSSPWRRGSSPLRSTNVSAECDTEQEQSARCSQAREVNLIVGDIDERIGALSRLYRRLARILLRGLFCRKRKGCGGL